MRFKKDDIVFLLGAGCSAEAGIPTSMKMIQDLEMLISGSQKDDRVNWTSFQELYFFIKSAMLYGSGIAGKFGEEANYNIEKLVNTLSELEKCENHPIYPFIGSWNNKLLEVGGKKFEVIEKLRQNIKNKLEKWVTIKNYNKAEYYSNFVRFQNEYTFPLRIFSLNYDLCVEHHVEGLVLERGFDDNNGRIWTSRKFEENENIPLANIYLYKMHGSINWERDDKGNLNYSDEITQISRPELIFGTNYKLQYTDPYLFYVTEFRKFTLEAQLIITIGYGFGDDHINKMLEQAIRNNPKRKILCSTFDAEERQKAIKKELNPLNDDQIIFIQVSAKDFLGNKLKVSDLEAYLPPEENVVEFS